MRNGAVTHVGIDSQHEVVRCAHGLVAEVGAWNQNLEAPRRAAAAAAEETLSETRASVSLMAAELDEMRKHCVLESVDRKTLSALRKKIADAQLWIGDLEAGLIEARRDLASPRGSRANGEAGYIRSICGHIRDVRATILGDVARDAQISPYVVAGLEAHLRQCNDLLDKLLASVKAIGAVPPVIADHVGHLRQALKAIWSEAQSCISRAA